jgi:O-antigen ligase
MSAITIQRVRPASALLAVSAVCAAAGMYFAVRLGWDPVWAIIAMIAAPAALFVMRRYPLVIMAGLLFVGNFKSVPARTFSLADPTMIMLLLAAGTIALDMLFDLAGAEGWTLSRLFEGQSLTVLLFLLLTAVLLTSFSFTPARQYGAMKVTRFAVFEVLAFFAPMVLLKSRKHLRQLVVTFVVLSLALVVRDVIQLLHPSASVMKGDTDITQIGDGMQFAIAILIVVYHRIARSHWLNYSALAVLVFGLIASAARSPVVALVITLVLSITVAQPVTGFLSRKRIAMLTAVAAIVAAVALLWMQELPGAEQKVAWKEAELESVVSGSLVHGGTISQRINFDLSAIEAVEHYPVLGLGAGGWSVFYSKQDLPRFPHNFILEVAAEQGLIGLTLLLTLLFLLFRSAHSLLGESAFAFILPVLAFVVIYNSMTGDIENRDLWFWFGMVPACARMTAEKMRRKVTYTGALA